MARKPKLDTVLAEAVDTARMALAEVTDESEIGEYIGAAVEGERLVTHRFVARRDGYRGWTWYVTLARIPRAKAKDATVCELGIIPGEQALLAPAWIPWADRLAQEEIEAAKQAAEQPASDGTQDPAANADVPATGQEAATYGQDGATQEPAAESASDTPDASEPNEEPARRPVRRRRTAQRTAARRRAAARNRTRNSGE